MINFLTHPVWPMLLAFGLYLAIGFGWAVKDRPWFGLMWVFYAGAIVCLIMDARR